MTDNSGNGRIQNALQDERIRNLTDRVTKLESNIAHVFYLLLGNLVGLIMLLLKELL